MAATLIVFYSRTGTTRHVAQQLATKLAAQTLAIEDVRSRAGMLGYVRSALEAMHGTLPEIVPSTVDLSRYDLVVLGTPVWAGHASSPMRRFLDDHARELPRVAFFCTMGGSGADGALREMRVLAGKQPDAVCVLVDRDIVDDSYHRTLDEFAERLQKPQDQPAAGQPATSA